MHTSTVIYPTVTALKLFAFNFLVQCTLPLAYWELSFGSAVYNEIANFSNSVTAALSCHLVTNKKSTKCITLIRGWSVNKRVNKLITINELFKHWLLSSESVLTTETCVETEAAHEGSLQDEKKKPSEEHFKIWGIVDGLKILKRAVCTCSWSTDELC